MTAMRDAHSRLKDLVLQHAFHPGQQLRARDLADRLKISATPVREALIRLSVEGLIVSVPHKGFYTKPLDLSELSDRYELAFMVSRYAVEKGIAHFTMRGLEEPAVPKIGGVGDVASKQHLALSQSVFVGQLLERIAGLAGNTAALALMQTFNDHTRYIRLLDLEDAGTARMVFANVSRLIGHLREKNPDLAVFELKILLVGTIERLPTLVKEVNVRALKHFFL
ncbi:GntR family transcriptional regulator [Methylobacterium nodulans]|nr:GntR family transcriptional regulator [Methylobacterium nodulans]